CDRSLMATGKGYVQIAEAIYRQDRPVFGLLGDANLAAMAKAVDLGTQFFACRHESAAVAMASGWAVTSGRVGFATTTRGPGFTNALTSLVSVVRDRIPVVYYVGDTPRTARHGAQNVDHSKIASVANATFLYIDDPAH